MNNIQVQGFNVLSELTHNDNGNPHPQYVGNTRDTILKPTFDENQMQYKTNNFWKICSFTLGNNSNNKVSLCFDVIDEYKNSGIKKASYQLQVVKINEAETSTAYYDNNIYLKLTGEDYDRVWVIQSSDGDDKIKVEVFIKISVSTNWNTSYVSVTYHHTNEPTFKFHNNERAISELPDGNRYVNTPNKPNLKTLTSPQDNSYVKLVEFNYNYNQASTGYIFTITRGKKDNADTFGYIKFMVKFYANGLSTSSTQYMNIRTFVIDSVNLDIDNLVFIRDGSNDRKIYVYGKYDLNEIYHIELDNHYDFSNTFGREIKIEHWKPVTSLPDGTTLKPRAKSKEYLLNTADNTLYHTKINNYNYQLFDSNNEQIATMVKPQSFTDSDASDINTLKTDFNNLLAKLRSAKVLK